MGQYRPRRLHTAARPGGGLLLRYSGLRISDVSTLERDRVRDGQILLHTQKTGGQVFLPIPNELQQALDALPCPRGANQNRWFLWNGNISERALVNVVARTLRAVFKRAGVEGAHAHRFRTRWPPRSWPVAAPNRIAPMSWGQR